MGRGRRASLGDRIEQWGAEGPPKVYKSTAPGCQQNGVLGSDGWRRIISGMIRRDVVCQTVTCYQWHNILNSAVLAGTSDVRRCVLAVMMCLIELCYRQYGVPDSAVTSGKSLFCAGHSCVTSIMLCRSVPCSQQ